MLSVMVLALAEGGKFPTCLLAIPFQAYNTHPHTPTHTPQR